jgi:hypothetical protein
MALRNEFPNEALLVDSEHGTVKLWDSAGRAGDFFIIKK